MVDAVLDVFDCRTEVEYDRFGAGQECCKDAWEEDVEGKGTDNFLAGKT